MDTISNMTKGKSKVVTSALAEVLILGSLHNLN